MDQETSVKKPTEQAGRSINSRNGSSARTISTSHHTAKDEEQIGRHHNNEIKEHVVTPILHHVQNGVGVHYVVHWSWYGPKHDTEKPSAYIP